MARLTRSSLGALAACEQIGRLPWRLRPDSREGGQRTTQVRTVGRRPPIQESQVIWIGIDAHKRVHQALALSADGVLGQKTIINTAVGWTELLRWASTWSDRIWAVEGSGSLGRGLAQFLAVRGERVHEVNPRWTARRRRGLRRPGKSDVLDAQAVAHLLREEGESLPLVQAETVASASLQLWSRLRDDVVLDMTRLRNRLHALLLLCDPEYKRIIRSLRSRIGISQLATTPHPELASWIGFGNEQWPGCRADCAAHGSGA